MCFIYLFTYFILCARRCSDDFTNMFLFKPLKLLEADVLFVVVKFIFVVVRTPSRRSAHLAGF